MLRSVALFMLSLLLSPASMAANLSVHRFELPAHGTLVVLAPLSWRSELEQAPEQLPPTVHFIPKDSSSELRITPAWAIGGQAPPLDPENIRKDVQAAADSAAPNAVEKQIEVKSITGRSGVGYYFFATDRAPKPGGYKYLLQGILPVDGLALTFTLLSNDESSAAMDATLVLLKHAVVSPGKS
jgi:hypothetical protein